MAKGTPFGKKFTNMRKKRDWFGSVTADSPRIAEENKNLALNTNLDALRYMMSPGAHMNPMPGMIGAGQSGFEQAAIAARNIINAYELQQLKEQVGEGITPTALPRVQNPDDYEFGSFGQSHPF